MWLLILGAKRKRVVAWGRGIKKRKRRRVFTPLRFEILTSMPPGIPHQNPNRQPASRLQKTPSRAMLSSLRRSVFELGKALTLPLFGFECVVLIFISV